MNPVREQFHGIISALLTPMDSGTGLNTDAVYPLIKLQLEMGMNGFFVGGSAGEVFLLDPDERFRLYKAASDAVHTFSKDNRNVSLIAHVGDFSTEKACRYASACREYGYDAVCSVLPFYFPCTLEQHRAYLRAIHDASGLPVFLYYIPMYNHVELSSEQLISLLSEDHICRIKFTNHDYGIFEKLRRTFLDKVMLNGLDHTFLCGLAMGADGAVGSHFNVIGNLFLLMESAYSRGDRAEAYQIQQKANVLIEFMNSYGDSKGAMKYILSSIKGIPMGECRLPGQAVPDHWKREFHQKYADCF